MPDRRAGGARRGGLAVEAQVGQRRRVIAAPGDGDPGVREGLKLAACAPVCAVQRLVVGMAQRDQVRQALGAQALIAAVMVLIARLRADGAAVRRPRLGGVGLAQLAPPRRAQVGAAIARLDI
jgi:hypothetical protein